MMRIYIPLFLVILSLSSCIKVENASLCAHPPGAPSLASNNVQIPSGSRLQLKVLAPDPGLAYVWQSPGGYLFNGDSVSSYPYLNYFGMWSVVAQKNGPTCASDTSRIMVTPGCGIGPDSFKVGALFYKLSSIQTTANGYYQISIQSTSGYILDIFFPSKPTTSGAYYLTSNDPYYLSSGYCTMALNNVSNYTSCSGTIYIYVSSSGYTISFCNAALYSYGQYTYVSANITGH